MLMWALLTIRALAPDSGYSQSLHVVRIDGPFQEAPIYFGVDTLVGTTGRYFEAREGRHSTRIRIGGEFMWFSLHVGAQGIVPANSHLVTIACANSDTSRLDWPTIVTPDSAYDSVSVLVFEDRENGQAPCATTLAPPHVQIQDSDTSTAVVPATLDTPQIGHHRDSAYTSDRGAPTFVFAGFDAATHAPTKERNSYTHVEIADIPDAHATELPAWQLKITSAPVVGQVRINGTAPMPTPADISIPYRDRNGRPDPSTDWIIVDAPNFVACNINTAQVIRNNQVTYHCSFRRPGPLRP